MYFLSFSEIFSFRTVAFFNFAIGEIRLIFVFAGEEMKNKIIIIIIGIQPAINWYALDWTKLCPIAPIPIEIMAIKADAKK